jgi:hypothetical protein
MSLKISSKSHSGLVRFFQSILPLPAEKIE